MSSIANEQKTIDSVKEHLLSETAKHYSQYQYNKIFDTGNKMGG